jgi:hypothetical protein
LALRLPPWLSTPLRRQAPLSLAPYAQLSVVVDGVERLKQAAKPNAIVPHFHGGDRLGPFIVKPRLNLGEGKDAP